MMNNRLVAMLVVAQVVAGCGRNEQADNAAGTQAAARATATAGADVVAAVLQSPGTPVAKLGFVVTTSPAVGAPSSLRLEISAPAPVPNLQFTAEGEGMAIDPATARVGFALATAGAVATHELRFTPQRDGLTEVTVRLRNEAGEETTYVIPLLVAKAAGG
jgi:hypothetical protein